MRSTKKPTALILRIPANLHLAAKKIARDERRSLNNTLNILVEMGIRAFEKDRKPK